jgi:hypothetical protein
VSAVLAEQTERPPAEFFGKARDLRRRVAAEDPVFDATVDALLGPVRDRRRRFPHRSLRQETLINLVQSWRFMPCRDWRLDLTARLDKGKASLCEYRLVAGEMRKPNDPNWLGHEDDVAAIKIDMAISGASVHLLSYCVTTFSLHALARRYQRGADSSDEALLHDCLVATRIDPATLPGAGGHKITTDEHGGGWRGRTVRQIGPDGVERRVLAIRTWMAA